MATVPGLEGAHRHHGSRRRCGGCAARGRPAGRGAAPGGSRVRGSEMNDAGLFGPRLGPDGVTFRLWAPAARRVELLLDRAHEMPRDADGWYELSVPGVGAGTLYKFAIDGELEVPDPASAFQPSDVHGPSEVVAQDFDWQTTAWRGRPWQE